LFDYVHESHLQLNHVNGVLRLLSQIPASDVLVGLTHVPFTVGEVSDMPQNDPAYDLILAGHYHGGQIRLPLLGAVYIPDAGSDRHGWFPEQNRARGLYDWGPFRQYVSAGLGASGSVRILEFRLFNRPEINLVRLVRG
jgi:uncharacterized protein